MSNSPNFKRYVIYLTVISCVIRLIFAHILELTNDEANYWTYALYPSLSYFDHPPMVGWLIRIFTFNLVLDSELFVRLVSILIGGLNTYIMFKIGARIKDEQTGFYAALLYNTSLYCFIIAGIFIMPDTPQLLFWLLSIHFFIKSIFTKEINSISRRSLLISGVFIGLALLSKYQSIFLWVGAILYVLKYNKQWLKTKELYVSILFSFIIFIPVLIWNYQNQFMSFTFQGERVNIISSGVRLDFLIELIGEIFYTNPITFVLILISIFKFKRLGEANTNIKRFLLLFSLPNILTFLVFSLFRKTLPHWTGPGYLVLLILTAVYISEKGYRKILKIPSSILLSFIVVIVILVLGYFQINYSLFPQERENRAANSLGRDDVTLDMFGWKQISDKFQKLNEKYVEENVVGSDVPIISNKWYNSGHLDYYTGRVINKKVYAAGNLNDTRNYIFVNRERGDLYFDEDAYYISPSRDFKNPDELFSSSFEQIIPLDTIRVYRAGMIAENVLIFKLGKYTGKRFY